MLKQTQEQAEAEVSTLPAPISKPEAAAKLENMSNSLSRVQQAHIRTLWARAVQVAPARTTAVTAAPVSLLWMNFTEAHGADQDSIHCMLCSRPKCEPLRPSLKRASSRLVIQQYPRT